MTGAPRCPGCGASLSPTTQRCPYCGQWLQAPGVANQDPWLPAWTQGIARDGYSDGSFDAVEYPAMPLSQALQILERLPVPPRVQDPGEYCPPSLGFGERSISRTEDGRYFLWPEDRPCSLEQARQIVRQIYGQT
jgi:hypothetical protein